MAPLKPSKLSEQVCYVFFDTECPQDLENRVGPFVHIPNLICAQQMCSMCEAVDDLSIDLNSVGSASMCSGKIP